MATVIEARGLGKQFDALRAVKELTLTVSEGEILALLGPNGAGKTTTVRMLSSILRPTSGSARVAGYDVVNQPRDVRKRVGHLTEFPGLYLRMRPMEYLDFFGQLHGMPTAYRRARAQRLISEFGLSDSVNRRLGEFSKGMRQKVALVRALLHEPRVVFLDEPTSAMDPLSAKQVRDAIVRLRRAGQTVLLCTHNLHEAESLADRIAIIRRGELLALGSNEELKARYLGPPVFHVRLAEAMREPWPQMEGVEIQKQDGLSLEYQTSEPGRVNPLLLSRLSALGASVLTLSEIPRSLEDVYLRLVGEP